MTVYSLETIVANAKTLSPYYRALYADVNPRAFALRNLPVVDPVSFWKANVPGPDNQVLTGPIQNGILFKSGGTTGSPKHSYYSRTEWNAMTGWFGRFQERNGFRDGDIVANLFYVGDLYSSFIFLHEAVRASSVAMTLLPLAGTASFDLVAQTLHDFSGNAILGIPTWIVAFADHIRKNGPHGLCIDRIRFGGETLYDDQRRFVESVFPGVDIASIGYASVDGGLLGFRDTACGFNEHRPFDRHNIIEFLDEVTGEPIEEENRPGVMHTTNLSRLLMPIIRYPVGDRGVWLEPPGTPYRRYRILGRTESGARVGTVTLYPDDVRKVLETTLPGMLHDFQLVVEHFEHKDRLTVRLGLDPLPTDAAALSERILAALHREREHLLHEKEAGHIHPSRIEWAHLNDLETNPRTGKRIRILDKRFD